MAVTVHEVEPHADQPLVRTLRAAQEQLNREWPGNGASDVAWLAFHQRGAELFATAARTDPAHHHEALYLAQCEREDAQTLIDRAAGAAQARSV